MPRATYRVPGRFQDDRRRSDYLAANALLRDAPDFRDGIPVSIPASGSPMPTIVVRHGRSFPPKRFVVVEQDREGTLKQSRPADTVAAYFVSDTALAGGKVVIVFY